MVFADQFRWTVFDQVAAAVRRAGGRAVRVTTQAPDWRNRLIDRLLYSRVIYLDVDSLATVASRLVDENVVDVQFAEYVGEALVRGDAASLPGAVGPALVARGALLDKLVVGELAGDRGVRVPVKLAADRVTLAEAVETLGLPLVVKGRIGAGGDTVRIVASVAEAERALNELSPNRGDLFFEQMVVGEAVGYQAVVGAKGVIMDAATFSIAEQAGSLLPPVKIQISNAPDLLEFGRHASEKLGVAGAVQMDIIRDTEGRYWLLDLNARAWGSMLASRAAGLDFAAAYLYSIGMRNEQPPPLSVRSDIIMTAFPRVVNEEIALHRPLGTIRAFLSHSFRYLRWLGLRYWLSQLLIVAGSLRTTILRTATARSANP